MNQWMAQMAKQAWDLQNERAKEGFNTSLGISNTIPGFRTFADGLQIAQLVKDTDNLRRDNARLRAQQEYLEGNNNNPNNGNAFNPYKTQPAMSFTGQGWSTGELAPNGQDWKQNSFSSLFGGLQNSNWKQSLPNGEGDNPYSFTEPTSEQAQRSVGEVPQSATLDDRLKDSFNLSDYMIKQPQAQVQPQAQPQGQPQMGRPQGNVDYLSDDYAMHNWVQNNGGGKPYLDMMKYAMNFAPLRESARQERIRNNIGIYENPESTQEQKEQARIQLASDLGQLDLGFDLQQKRNAAQLAKDKLLIDAGFMPQWMEDAIGGGMDTESNNETDYSGVNLEGKSWVRNGDSVDLSNAKPNTIAGLNHISDIFQKTTGKPLIVTSGNDGNIHAGGEFSHGNGWKVDVSGNGLEDPKIRYPFIKQCESLGITVRDEYDNPSPNSTGSHLDLTFNGYKGSRPTQNRWSALSMTPKMKRQIAKDNMDSLYKRAMLELSVERNALRRAQLMANGGKTTKQQEQMKKILANADNSALKLNEAEDAYSEDINSKKLLLEDKNKIKEKRDKNYKTAMDKYGKDLGEKFSALLREKDIDVSDLNDDEIVKLGAELYERENKKKTGLQPYSLAGAVARGLFLQNGYSSYSVEDLTNKIIGEINDRAQGTSSTPTDTNKNTQQNNTQTKQTKEDFVNKQVKKSENEWEKLLQERTGD